MGQPSTRNGVLLRTESIGAQRYTRGTETSKYLEEKKTKCDSLSSGERTGSSPNRMASAVWGCGASHVELQICSVGEQSGKADRRG